MMLDHALAYARKGWAVLPLWWPEVVALDKADRVCACPAGADCRDPGKHPWVAHGSHDASTDPDQIRAWWTRRPQSNIGIATGKASGLWVLDIDPAHGGAESFAKAGPRPPVTAVAVTGSAGRHIYWRPWGPIPCLVGMLPGLDVRGDGGLVVAPPSMHGNGTRYYWHPEGHPSKVAVQSPPEWVRRLVESKRSRPKNGKHYSGAKPRIDIDALPLIVDGSRNRDLYRLCCRMIWEGREPGELEAAAREINSSKCNPPLADSELSKIVRSAERHRT